MLHNALPSPALLPFVRAYAQREIEANDPAFTLHVIAQLEQVINFELGVLPGLFHRTGTVRDRIWVGGSQTSFAGYMSVVPGVQTFAVIFYPTGLSRLINFPASEITDRCFDATSVCPSLRTLWSQLGEETSFKRRVAITEKFLTRLLSLTVAENPMAAAAANLFRHKGNLRIADIAAQKSLGIRQFERLFFREIGITPKSYARIARFQAALDARLNDPSRSWTDIAHDLGFHDQMHMIHDFQKLAHDSPSGLLSVIGDTRPPALTGSDM
jgi:AraC-like DNA-binding protein